MELDSGPDRPAAAARRRLGVAQLLKGMAESFRRARPRLWWAAAFVAVALSAAIYAGFYQARFGRPATGFALGVLRLLIAQLGVAALYRAVLRPDVPLFRIDASTFRFIGGSTVIFGFIAGFLLLGRLWVFSMTAALDMSVEARVAFRVVAVTVLAVLLSCAFLRTQPWLAALATGRRDLGLARSWAETTGSTLSLIAVWLMLVMPLMVLNVALSLFAGRAAEIGPNHLAYAAAEAIGVAAIAVVTALLNATVLRWIDGELER